MAGVKSQHTHTKQVTENVLLIIQKTCGENLNKEENSTNQTEGEREQAIRYVEGGSGHTIGFSLHTDQLQQ